MAFCDALRIHGFGPCETNINNIIYILFFHSIFLLYPKFHKPLIYQLAQYILHLFLLQLLIQKHTLPLQHTTNLDHLIQLLFHLKILIYNIFLFHFFLFLYSIIGSGFDFIIFLKIHAIIKLSIFESTIAKFLLILILKEYLLFKILFNFF